MCSLNNTLKPGDCLVSRVTAALKVEEINMIVCYRLALDINRAFPNLSDEVKGEAMRTPHFVLAVTC